MAILYFLKADINRIYYGTDTRFFSLGLGAALAVVWPIESLNQQVERKVGWILDLVGLASFALMLAMFFSMDESTTSLYLLWRDVVIYFRCMYFSSGNCSSW